jgi:hypothetical protein
MDFCLVKNLVNEGVSVCKLRVVYVVIHESSNKIQIFIIQKNAVFQLRHLYRKAILKKIDKELNFQTIILQSCKKN